MLISMGSCPFCLNGNNTPCFATYDNGYNCFTCGKKKSTDRLQWAYRPSLINSDKSMILPKDCVQNVNEFSTLVLKWLYSYFVYDDIIKQYNIAYCPYAEFGVFKGESIILPVIVNGELVSYQRRFFPNKQFITKGDKTSPFLIKCEGSTCLVLVEDYISAVRVGQYANVLCLSGVNMTYLMSKLIENFDMNIEIWLDPDEAGKMAACELREKLSKSLENRSKYRAFQIQESRTVKIRSTELQPKNYTNEELKQILGVKHAGL